MRKTSEPALDTALVPKERYLSPDVMRLEWERMWRRVWLYAGPLSDLAAVGDYFTFEIGPESVLVVRTAADKVQAMYNVCQHRGRRIRPEGFGSARALTCPYHRWSYDLEGRLISAPDSDFDFPQGDPVAGVRLSPVRCEVFEGLVFVNFDDGAQPLADYLTHDVMEHLGTYRWASEFHINLDWTVAWPCNWKIGVDSFNELYHLQGIHPELMDMSDDTPAGCPLDFYGRHSRFIYRVGVPGPRWDDEMARGRGYRDRNQITAGVRMILKGMGLEPRPEWEGHVKELRPILIEAARERAAKQRVDTSALVDDQLLDDFHYFLFPNITLNISAHHFWLFRHRPHPRDPEQMLWDFQQFVRVRPGQSAPPRPAHQNYVIGDGHEAHFPHIALAQDEAQAEELQRGMRSAGFKGLYLAHQERRIRYFHSVLDDYLSRF